MRREWKKREDQDERVKRQRTVRKEKKEKVED